MGSQFISTRLRLFDSVSVMAAVIVLIFLFLSLLSSIGSRVIASCELLARMSPFRLFVNGVVGDLAQRSYGAAINSNGARRNGRPGRFIHERHELIRKAGHRAANTDAADVRTSADTCHPTPFRNIAVHYRTPATHFDEALGSAISVRELSLLVI